MTVAGDDNWNSPLNWAPDSGVPDDANDTAFINSGTDTIILPTRNIKYWRSNFR